MIKKKINQKLVENSLSSRKSAFTKAVDKLRKEKKEVYARMESQANDPETIRYYAELDKCI